MIYQIGNMQIEEYKFTHLIKASEVNEEFSIVYAMFADSTDVKLVATYSQLESCEKSVCIIVEEGDNRQLIVTVFGKKMVGLINLTVRSRIKIGEEVSEVFQDDIL